MFWHSLTVPLPFFDVPVIASITDASLFILAAGTLTYIVSSKLKFVLPLVALISLVTNASETLLALTLTDLFTQAPVILIGLET